MSNNWQDLLDESCETFTDCDRYERDIFGTKTPGWFRVGPNYCSLAQITGGQIRAHPWRRSVGYRKPGILPDRRSYAQETAIFGTAFPMEIDESLTILRNFIATAREFEQSVTNVLPPWPSGQLIWRLTRLQDAVARARRQAGHMAADLVLAPDADCWRELETRYPNLFKNKH
jgi:hypothetical protein